MRISDWSSDVCSSDLLDVETLDLLEESIVDFAGTVLVVSHDRAFLNNVVMRTLAYEGDGRIGEYIGGYDDWLRQRPEPVAKRAAPLAKPATPPPPASTEGRR